MSQKVNLLVCVLLLFVLPFELNAQEEAPVAYIERIEAQSVFPVGVQFDLRIIAPATDELVALRLELIGLAEERIVFTFTEIDTDVIQRDEDGFTVRYFWQLPGIDIAPAPFEGLQYAWFVELTESDVQPFSNNAVFIDPRFEWQSIELLEAPFKIHLPTENVGVERIIEQLNPIAAELVERSGSTVMSTHFVLYPHDAPVGCIQADDGTFVMEMAALQDEVVVVPCNPDLATMLYARNGFNILRFDNRALPITQSSLVDAMVAAFYADYWQEAEVPAWFRLGFASLYDNQARAEELLTGRNLARSDQYLDIAQMMQRPAEQSVSFDPWRAQAIGMVLYMANRFGLEVVLEFATQLADYSTFEDAYSVVFGEPPTTLARDWSFWVLGDSVVSIYGVNLFVPPTATATFTMTPHPPTQPPMVGATMIPTATAVPTLDATATRIPVQPTATFTPLPPQRVLLMTPTPVPIGFQFALPGNVNYRQIGILLIIAFGGTIIALIVGRSSR